MTITPFYPTNSIATEISMPNRPLNTSIYYFFLEISPNKVCLAMFARKLIELVTMINYAIVILNWHIVQIVVTNICMSWINFIKFLSRSRGDLCSFDLWFK